MFNFHKLHQNEQGQTALEAAIILIAFVVVASIFAFAILSAGTASTERGEQAIYSGLEGVQSSMQLRGSVIAAESTDEPDTVGSITFTVSLVSGGEPVDVTDADSGNPRVIIGYRTDEYFNPAMDWSSSFIGSNDDDLLLEEGELAQFVVTMPEEDAATTDIHEALGTDTQFTIEVKPPAGAILNVTRTTPAALEPIMELR